MDDTLRMLRDFSPRLVCSAARERLYLYRYCSIILRCSVSYCGVPLSHDRYFTLTLSIQHVRLFNSRTTKLERPSKPSPMSIILDRWRTDVSQFVRTL